MLLLGGPLHGQEKEVNNGESELIIMAPSPGNPIPTPFKYIKRSIQAETKPGWIYEKIVLVEQTMPVEVATQALAAILMQRFAEELVRQFMESGTIVESPWQYLGSENDSSTVGTSSDETSSGIVIARR
jgi:hypothetical protein